MKEIWNEIAKPKKKGLFPVGRRNTKTRRTFGIVDNQGKIFTNYRQGFMIREK